jgi:uncharacterized integral membrane protein
VTGQRKALVVANDAYEQDALRNLLAPAADAEALRQVLADPQIGDFAVQVVRNEPSHVIQAQIEDLFSDSRPDDVLLMHFSGHGLKSESGELFFAASNTRPNRLGSTAVSADFVQRCMRASRSRSVVLLLDCCYAGAFAQGVTVRAGGDVNVLDSFPQERTGGGRGRAVITASNAMEYAFEGDQLADDQHRRPSVFTTALVEGLATGDADQDEDGWVSLNELYEYVFDKVREQNPHQTPSRQVELEGELYLARSRRRRIRPAPIPPDLRAALTDPSMYARLGAVGELRSRLASDSLPAAAGAYDALAELAGTDIQAVAAPAAAALAEAAVQPAQTELNFGQIAQGSAPPHQTVELLGPPIARACVPRPSDDWIGVSQAAEGLDISIDTTSTGARYGRLDLKGHTGEAVVDINVDIVPPAPRTRTPRRPDAPTFQGIMAPPPRTPRVPSAPPAGSKPSRPQPGQREAEQLPATAKLPNVKTNPENQSAPAKTPERTPLPAASQEEPDQKEITGRPEQKFGIPIVWPVSFTLLAVLLFILGLENVTIFALVTYTTSWQIILGLAILSVLVVAIFERRSLKRLETFICVWNFAWFLTYAAFILKIHGSTLTELVVLYTTSLAIAAAVNAVYAVFAFVRIAKKGRSASNILLFLIAGSIAVGALLGAVSISSPSIGLVRGSGIILLGSSLASLTEAVVMLAMRPHTTLSNP